jgi:hypothetical protein
VTRHEADRVAVGLMTEVAKHAKVSPLCKREGRQQRRGVAERKVQELRSRYLKRRPLQQL